MVSCPRRAALWACRHSCFRRIHVLRLGREMDSTAGGACASTSVSFASEIGFEAAVAEGALLAARGEAAAEAGSAADRDDGCQIYHTSGTTGFPKGVLLSNSNVCLHAFHAIEEFEFNQVCATAALEKWKIRMVGMTGIASTPSTFALLPTAA